MKVCTAQDCQPEITGKTSNVAGASCDQKLFSAGNRLSSNAISSKSSTFTKENIGTLNQDYVFEIIPRTPETEGAGYFGTSELYKQAQVWYGPTADKNNFYYTAYSGSVLAPDDPTTRSTILVSRKRCDGSLNWARNTFNFYPQSLNPTLPVNVCRVAPAIYKDTLYLIDTIPQRQGPWVFAVNKHTGQLKWSLGLFPGDDWTPTRIGDQNIVVTAINGVPNLFVGNSSLQNTDANSGMHGLPVYTDQGFLFRIEDRDTHGVEVARFNTCAPLVQVGDVVTEDMLVPEVYRVQGGGMVIGTTSGNSVINPYVFNSDPNVIPPPLAASGFLSIPIGASITASSDVQIQGAWSLAGQGITVQEYGGQQLPDQLNSQQVLSLLRLPQNAGKVYFLTAYLTQDQLNDLLAQQNNFGLAYFRVFYLDDPISSPSDAQGFNYFGNSVWGPPVTIDGDKQRVYFGTGQSHSLPFHELAFYEVASRSYINYKQRIAEAADLYLAVPSTSNLQSLNSVKDEFVNMLKRESTTLSVFSERGRRSFSDAVMALDLDLNFKWGFRTIPMDVYVFDPSIYIIMTGYGQTIDGDVSSGCHLFRRQCIGRDLLATAPKSGIGAVFDHSDENDVVYLHCQYLGPASALGGSNYQATQSLGHLLLPNQTNTPLFESFQEKMITREGVLIPYSFNVGFDVRTGTVSWNAPLDAPALGQPAGVNGIVLTPDLVGNLYAHDMLDGRRLWKFDTQSSEAPGNGGIASACVLKDQVLWIPSYNAIQYGAGTQRAASYKVDDRASLNDYCNPNEDLRGNTYSTTYHTPLPSLILSISQRWDDRKSRLNATILLNGQKTEIRYKYVDGLFVEKKRSPANSTLQVSFSELLVFSKNSYQLTTRIAEIEWKAVFSLVSAC